MTELNVVVKDKLGIHARPAAVIAKTAATFKSKITLELNGKHWPTVSCRSCS